MLLFGKNPRRFFNNAQVHCFHFHGTEKQKPIASQQPYEGRLFEVIDQAVEFVTQRAHHKCRLSETCRYNEKDGHA
jgi:predicted HTH transcriptional regulator